MEFRVRARVMVMVTARASASRKPHATRSVHVGPAHLHGQRRRDQAVISGGLEGGWLEHPRLCGCTVAVHSVG